MGEDNREELIAENEKELADAVLCAGGLHSLGDAVGATQFASDVGDVYADPCVSIYLSIVTTGFASGASSTITPVLERVLEEIRVTGVPRYSWPHLKKLLIAKLQIAMDQVAAADTTATTAGMGWSPTNKNKSSERRSNITELLNTFEGPPFTLQRLTEVILEPQKSYKTLNKLINALEKLLAVSTTIQVVDPRAPAGAALNATEENVMQAPLSVQVVQGNTEGDVVARAPWGNAEASS